MAPASGFTGEFHFVNYNASSRKASSHRREVSTHMQSKYHRWKRQEKVRQFRASAQIPRIEAIDEAIVLSPRTPKRLSYPLCDEPRQPTETRGQYQYILEPIASPLSSPFTSQLDPFFNIPCHITNHEKSLLQYYLTAEQEPIFGHAGDSSDPVRPRTTILLQSDQIYLQWVILATEVMLLRGTSVPVDTPHILSRKVHIYKLMSQAIKDPIACCSDNILSAMATAGVAEALLGNAAQGRKHLLAGRLLIQRRGGPRVLQNIAFGEVLPIFASYIFNGTGEATFPNHRPLRDALDSFTSTFQAMQRWNQNLRAEFEKVRVNGLDVAKVRDLQQYRFSRRKVFGKSSKLRPYLERQRIKTTPGNQQFYFVLLWMLNKVLYDLRTNYDSSIALIEQLLRDVEVGENSGWERDHTATDRICLRPGALFCIIAGCAVKYSSEDGERQGILYAWDAIDMLELMQLARIDSQEEVKELLSSWLINDESDMWYVGEKRAKQFQEEIETEWTRRQG